MTFSVSKLISDKQMIEEMHHMLTYMRPHGTKHEQEFVSTFVDNLPNVWSDGYGNRHVVIGDTNILWSCHTDSVHHDSGRQVVIKRDGTFKLKPGQFKTPSCLGADCATGVWLMRNMIRRGVKGHYIFHRDEECGGLGSSWIATKDPDLLNGVEIAIAFDRKGYDSVITHQGKRTASNEFANSIAGLLGGKYKPDPTGLFTDTAKYAEIIPECSNLSVGYHDAHSSGEWQDYEFALDLLNAVSELDITKLTVSRDPKVIEYQDFGYGNYRGGAYRWTDHYDWSDYDVTTGTSVTKAATTNRFSELWDEEEDARSFRRSSSRTNYDALYDLVLRQPDAIADWLDGMGLDADELSDVLWK